MRPTLPALAGLVAILFLAGCAGPRDAPSSALGAPVMTYEQEFVSTTLRGTLAVRVLIEPQAGETCTLLTEATVVRSTGRFCLFVVGEKKDGQKFAAPYNYGGSDISLTVLGSKSSTLIAGPVTDHIKFPAKFNETRARSMTLYFEDIDATKAPFKLRIQCPNEPLNIELAGSRQAAIIDPSRSSAAYLEAELCPDLVIGAGGTDTIHVDGPMRFWFTSQPSVGLMELVGPQSTKQWELANKYDAETVDGPPGDYRINLHRVAVEQAGAYDMFAAGIGSFPALTSLEDLHPAPPRAAHQATAHQDGTCA